MNSTTTRTASPVTLGTFSTRLVLSAVQKSGGVIFTGDRASSTCGDKFTTQVSVLADASCSTAQIHEAPDAVNCHVNFSACVRSETAHPGRFPSYLGIVWRQDSTTIMKCTKIESVLIQYTGGTRENPVPLDFCPSPASCGASCTAARACRAGR